MAYTKVSIVAVVILLGFHSCPALSYEDGPSKDELAQWFVDARKGDAEAEYNIAESFLKGEGVHQDEREAADWYYKSAMQGYPPAEFAMGFVYRGGNGIPIDKVLSYMWFDLAAKNGDTRAARLRDDVAWSMTETEILEAQQKSSEWEPSQRHYLGSE